MTEKIGIPKYHLSKIRVSASETRPLGETNGTRRCKSKQIQFTGRLREVCVA